MNGHFTTCDICGAPGHSAKNCGLRKLEERRDPFGELIRVERRRALARKFLPPGSSLLNVQSSPRFGS